MSIPKSLILSCLLADFATGFQLSYNLFTIHNGLITPNDNDNVHPSKIDSSIAMTVSSRPVSFPLEWSSSSTRTCSRHNLNHRPRIGGGGGGSRRRSSTDLRLRYSFRDADYGELLAGGQRYEMVELPDSMVDTTIFVGNLCEVSTCT